MCSSDDDEDELFLRNGWPKKDVNPYFQPGPLSEVLKMINLIQGVVKNFFPKKCE